MNSKYSDLDRNVFIFQNATKGFDNKCILHKSNFSFKRDKNYLITGESGIGKTTLLNIFAGLDTLDEGMIKKNNNLATQYLFQDTLLFTNLTVKENLFIKMLSQNSLQENAIENLVHKTLRSVGIDQTLSEKTVYYLSGGEQRRVQLAQILLCHPDVVLLDEPTANLDNNNKQVIIELINTKFPNAVKIIVGHDLENISEDYITLILENGELHYA